ncbi:hypothetical protein NKR23_g819 [Pleurostoma richardsiae]|uniref:NmrA-like domain-containing protein n=1 Tax=Pleurostoma richardsiae TaxID=41990 RepID=A0AA38RSC5_9PEZI|nr:hypothetical protein NKR23_g819 [Pleurostoma richardsiae]
MSTIQKVAIVGGNGALGAPVLKALLAAGFEVTALSRAAGKVAAQPHLTEVVIDFADHAALVSALKGLDAVVSTTGNQSGDVQIALVNAAVEAGIKRFIPSDFGSDLQHPEIRSLPVFAEKIKVQELLIQKSKETSLTYTFINNNAFLDWGLEHKFILDPVDRKATLWDGGEHLVTLTSLATVGQGVVGVLKHPEETKNRVVYIQEVAVSLKKLVGIVQEAAPGHTWAVTVGDSKEAATKAIEALSNHVYEPWVFLHQIFRAAAGKGGWAHFEKNDNKLLGVKELDDEELKKAVKETLQKIPGAI